ncbi:ATPase [Gaeumannomyces tritici R3-111a-1]|uniref:ATPase n=1 Tax=Gaeumannomyces tritici (strain R3-111a-1) TaxID=644352 RepID=J3P4E2_GAET3|nr:ATPase [Gaeumannomyces tritici R3-111a-1]EJT74538.1 ATPase [Gaeumannomyces tritici R3-111a-1]
MAVKQFIEIKFRPATADKATSASGPSTLKGASRVQIRKDSLIELTGSVENGRLCYIERIVPEGSATDGPAPTRREAVLWLTPDPNLGRAVAKVSRSFQEAAGLNYTDTYRIIAAESAPEAAKDVVFEEITPVDSAPPIQDKWMASWVANLKAELDILDLVFPGMVLKDITFMRQKRTFVLRSVNGLEHNDCCVVPETSCAIVTSAEAAAEAAAALLPPPDLQVAAIEGLEEQVRELNCALELLSGRFSASMGTAGLVLHGGAGTGKSTVLDRIAATGWGTVHRIRPTDKSSAIADVFKACRAQPRGLVLIDDLDKLIDKERANRSTVVNALAEGLDALSADMSNDNEKAPLVVVVAVCRDYLTSIPEELRYNGRLEWAVLLPPLDANRRRAIISALTSKTIHADARPDVVSSLSERTHAYNGRDLQKLLRRVAGLTLEKMKLGGLAGSPTPDAAVTGDPTRKPEDERDQQPSQSPPPEPPRGPAFYRDVVETALLKVRPTAMQDVNLKPPPVRWDDISGQDAVKEELRFAVGVLTMPPDDLAEHIGAPPKGFLLYGPPGCSKTMTAQAVATECGLNFFAVKGAELLNMYVGESERQVRDLFARARAAAPSMIFFDEIDSIAGSRKGFGDGSSSSSGGSGLNVLTTLLNEMDGFEDLRGVLVLAATNRPQSLDPAIMRPGRFDEIVYVPPPDAAARESILRRALAPRRLAPGTDFARLVALSEGNSGAEVVGACRNAGKLSLRRRQKLREGGGDDGYEGISMQDLETSIASQRKLITADMLQAYADWERQFR